MSRPLVEQLPPPQRLALSYAPSSARCRTLALLALDTRLAGLLRTRGEPVLAQMRLAWWRDILAAEPNGWPRGEPVLALLRNWREPARLVALVNGWEALLSDPLDATAIAEFASGRAEGFAQLAREVACDPAPATAAARAWALGDLAAHLADPAERDAVIEMAADFSPIAALPRPLRPLAVLAGLARRSLARGGTALLDGPGAALTAIRLGIAGR
jgi:phytoene synthase